MYGFLVRVEPFDLYGIDCMLRIVLRNSKSHFAIMSVYRNQMDCDIVGAGSHLCCKNYIATKTKKIICCANEYIEPSLSATSETNLLLNLAMLILLVKLVSRSQLIVELNWRILQYLKKQVKKVRSFDFFVIFHTNFQIRIHLCSIQK